MFSILWRPVGFSLQACLPRTQTLRSCTKLWVVFFLEADRLLHCSRDGVLQGFKGFLAGELSSWQPIFLFAGLSNFLQWSYFFTSTASVCILIGTSPCQISSKRYRHFISWGEIGTYRLLPQINVLGSSELAFCYQWPSLLAKCVHYHRLLFFPLFPFLFQVFFPFPFSRISSVDLIAVSL